MVTAMIHDGILPQPARRRPAAFTLIELLVVITLIVTLIAILLPALAHARRAAEQALCLSNLSQYGKAHLAYAADFNDYTLQMVGKERYFASGYTDWWVQIAPYGIDVTRIVCRTLAGHGGVWNDPVSGTYAINTNFGQWSGGLFPGYPEWRFNRLPRKMSHHKRPTDEASFVDRGGDPDHPLGPDSDRFFNDQYGRLGDAKLCPGFHQDGFIVVYLDGHARHMSRPNLMALSPLDAFYGDPTLW
jgi:prepilin-type processing-associated H-X9-DG protein